MIMKGFVQWNPVYGWEDFSSSGDRIWTARSVGQRLTHWATGAPRYRWMYYPRDSQDITWAPFLGTLAENFMDII